MEFLGAFESTFLPLHGVDVAQISGHDGRWLEDVEALLASGVRKARHALRWHRIEPEPGVLDWTATDRQLEGLRERGIEPIVDLVHHTSYPSWLSDGFRDRRFGPAYLAYAEAVAQRYPWLTAYTLFNEPFATLFLSGHEALWPPYDRGVDGFVRLARNVLPAVSEASRCWSELLPAASHLWVDTCEHHAGSPGEPAAHAALCNDRRHVLLDLALGRHVEADRPFVRQLLARGGEALLQLDPVRVDVLGLDYYCHSEWWYDEDGSHSPSPHPLGLAALVQQYHDRYRLPVLLSETNVRGLPSDRATWLKYTLEQCEVAATRGVPVLGYCWFPFVDSCDWDSLLARPAGRVDPVGVLSLRPDGSRERTVCTESWEAAVRGAPSSELPAYHLQTPCDGQLAGFAAQTAHWRWTDPPEGPVPPAAAPSTTPEEIPMTDTPDLVVLSHLRWTWVWQRPQHLVSRFASARAADGARTFFVEEPVASDVGPPRLRTEDRDGVTRVWLEVPRPAGHPDLATDRVGFDDEGTETYGEMLAAWLADLGRPASPDVLVYTPMALDAAHALRPSRLAYDVMDDLASFLNAPEGLRLRQRRLMSEADVVFAGGRSLFRAVSQQRRHDVHLFPSGVETGHYAASRALRATRTDGRRRVAGYVGVIDERVDLDLLAGLAQRLPDWTVRVVGPIAKIDPAALPQAPNLEYPGMAAYDDLPAVMADLDVALMPFALNEATRSISPTKTLEYLAAGLPVVSTRVPDVVADYAGVVHLVDDADDLAVACRTVYDDCRVERDRKVRPLQLRLEWDVIAAEMGALLRGGAGAAPAVVDLTVTSGVTA